jgi:hypothetical protein
MAYSSSGDLRSRFAAFTRAWFNPVRWPTADRFVALAGPVLLVAVFLPWFKATLRFTTSETTGDLMDPPGSVSGVAAHEYLLVPVAVALLASAVILARHFPSRRAPRLPFHKYFLVGTSGLVFILVIVGAVVKPAAWFGQLQLEPVMYITIDWTYGAFVAVSAALISLGIAVSTLRSDGI